MGGGLSSLSKIAVLSTPGEGKLMSSASSSQSPVLHPFADGVSWADDVSAASNEDNGWDVVYRFAQVGVRDHVVDWGSTCGNLVAGVAHVRFRFSFFRFSRAEFTNVVFCYVVCCG